MKMKGPTETTSDQEMFSNAGITAGSPYENKSVHQMVATLSKDPPLSLGWADSADSRSLRGPKNSL
jgi:hypothetical protein